MFVYRHRQFDGNINRTSRWLWLIIVLEGILFWRYVSTQVAPFYATGFDQAGYLAETYRLFEAMRSGNFTALAADILGPSHPTGITFEIQGALLALLLGTGRASLLSLNFLYFAALQVVLFQTVRWKTGNSRLALIAVALLLSQSTLTHMTGGMFDYRIDFAAYCTFGIWTCFVLRSGLFKERRWSVAAGFTTALLMSMRFLTPVYFVPIMAVIFLFLIVRYGSAKSSLRRAAYSLRIYNFFMAAAISGFLVLPLFWLKRSAIYAYYVFQHVAGPGKHIRKLEQGIKSAADALTYYPKSIVSEHLGGVFLLAASILFAATFLLTVIARLRGASRLRPQLHSFVPVLAAILVPLGVLTFDPAKSPVVGSIVCIPLLLLLILACSVPLDAWPPRLHPGLSARSFSQAMMQTVAMALIVTVTLATFIIRLNGRPAFNYENDDLRLINEVEDSVVSFAAVNKLLTPALSVDHVSEAFHASTMKVAAYERFGKLIDFQEKLGCTNVIFQTDRDTALKQIEESDIVILTDLPKTGVFPLDQSVRNYWNDLWAWSNGHLVLDRVFEFSSFNAYLFVRPLAAISGTSGAWITNSGITIRTNAALLRRFPIFILEGNTNFEWLPRLPKPKAELLGDDKQVVETMPTAFKRDGSRYSISIDGRSALSSNQDPVQVRLTFDIYFVPKLLGVNEDNRELVITAPTSVKLMAADEAGFQQN
jgi:hypothetical protein